MKKSSPSINFMLFAFCLLPVSHPNGLLASTDCINTCLLGNLVGFMEMVSCTFLLVFSPGFSVASVVSLHLDLFFPQYTLHAKVTHLLFLP